jgi:hypothetical protein
MMGDERLGVDIVKTGRVDMPASLVNDPEHWRDRAREKRALAERLRSEQAKQAMLRIANDYERLAQRAEEQSSGSPQPVLSGPLRGLCLASASQASASLSQAILSIGLVALAAF